MSVDKPFVLENIEIHINSHFETLNGLRILHFSDLHLTRPNKKFDNFFAHLNKIECDLAIVSGDVIDNDNGIDPCVKYLTSLKPKYGTFITYGNHDKYKLGLREFMFFNSIKKFIPNNLNLLETKLKDNGINVLDNKITHLGINGIGVDLIGIDCPLGYDRFHDLDRFKNELAQLSNLISCAIKENYIILISHVPDLIKELDTHNINIILSSHTHGGQIRLPLLGPLLTRSSFQRKYNMGIFRYNSCNLHISSGLGVSSTTPVRFRCPPRATVITLKSDIS